MSDIHLAAEYPEGATPEQKKDVRAAAFQHALLMASSDPEIRLRMILGEAYQRYMAVVRWIVDEIGKDEAKACGLRKVAERFAIDPSLLEMKRPAGLTPSAIVTQRRLLIAAVAQMMIATEEAGDPKQIEHQSCEPLSLA